MHRLLQVRKNGCNSEPEEDLLMPGVWEVMVDATFMTDMYLNFRTAFICRDGGDVLMTSRRAIAKRYASGFLVVDILSTLPWDIFIQNGGLGLVQLFKASKFMRLSRAIRILKIVRILRLVKVCLCCGPQHQAVPCEHGLIRPTGFFFFSFFRLRNGHSPNQQLGSEVRCFCSGRLIPPP